MSDQKCSFCQKTRDEVDFMVTGNNEDKLICDECIVIVTKQLKQSREKKTGKIIQFPRP